MIHRIDSVNPDIDDRTIKPNQARMAKNLRFAVSSTDENMSGGILVTGNKKLNFTPPPGTNKVIGICHDYENQVVYFANYNRREIIDEPVEFNHGIYQIKDNVVTLIIQGSWLNFQPDMDVSIEYIDGKLYWTDGLNQPKMINIAKATGTLFEDGLQVTYSNSYAEWMYTQIKRPGALPLFVALFKSKDEASQISTYSITENFPIGSFDYIPNTESEQVADGYQFSYYYIYDNYEESRLAPISDITFFSKKLELILPVEEFSNYMKDNNVIRNIVIVYRRGNEGSWNILKKIDNTSNNYSGEFNLITYDGVTITNYGPTIRYSAENMIFAQVLPVDADITDSFFDAVPITSTCNTIAINRIFHSNYVIDYPDWTDLSVNFTLERQGKLERLPVRGGGFIERFVPKVGRAGDRTFMYGRYKAGIELLDDYGRRIGVIGAKEFIVPKPTYTKRLLNYPNGLSTDVYEKNLYPNNDANFMYQIRYEISGSLPSWVKSYRVVMTKNLDYLFFFKTQVKIFYWYSRNNAPILSTLPVFYAQNYGGWFPMDIIQSDDKKDNYNYEGLAFRFTSREPFIWNPDEETYICFAQEYEYTFEDFPEGGRTQNTEGIELKEYKIDSYDGTYLFVKRPNADVVDSQVTTGNRRVVSRKPDSTQLISTFICTEPPTNSYKKGDGDAWVLSRQSLQYQVYVYSKKKQSTEIYYQNNNTYFVPNDYNYGTPFNASGIMRGDCYLAEYKKIYSGVSLTEVKFYFNNDVNANYTNPGDVFTSAPSKENAGITYSNRDVKVSGFGIAMNPCDIFESTWSSSIGQPSIVNENQKQTIARNDIIPSGQIILGSKINNLNRFNSVDAQSMPAENGPITATVITNTGQMQPGVMLAIGTLGVQSIYLNAIQQTASDGTSAITLSKNVLGSNRPLIGQYGTQKLRSINVTPEGVVYWWSEVVYDLIRYTNAGMERLGKTYMFANYVRNNYANNPSIFTVYDQVTDEAIVVPYRKPSIAFNEKYKSFQGQREYYNLAGETPERGVGLANRHYFFLNGEVWVTEVIGNNNKFFDSDKAAELTIITNELPSTAKTWNTIKIFGPVPSRTECKTEADVNRITEIERSWYVFRKNDYEAAIRRDINSGGILSGKPMESRILYSTFVFDINGFDKLNFIEVKSNKSVVQ